jgi:hypothetical protein
MAKIFDNFDRSLHRRRVVSPTLRGRMIAIEEGCFSAKSQRRRGERGEEFLEDK